MTDLLTRAVTITITVESKDSILDKPTIVTYRKGKGRWERFWTGYGRTGDYEVDKHDREAKGGPEDEIRWAEQVGHDVDYR